jgi:hypothetical protein
MAVSAFISPTKRLPGVPTDDADKRRQEGRYQELKRENAELRDRLRLIEEGLQAINSRVDELLAKRPTLKLPGKGDA